MSRLLAVFATTTLFCLFYISQAIANSPAGSAASPAEAVNGTWVGVQHSGLPINGYFNRLEFNLQMTPGAGSASGTHNTNPLRFGAGSALSGTVTVAPSFMSAEEAIANGLGATTEVQGEYLPALRLLKIKYNFPRKGNAFFFGVMSEDHQSVALVTGGNSGSGHLPVYLSRGSELPAGIADIPVINTNPQLLARQKQLDKQKKVTELSEQMRATNREYQTEYRAGNKEKAAQLEEKSAELLAQMRAAQTGQTYQRWASAQHGCAEVFHQWTSDDIAKDPFGGLAKLVNVFRPSVIEKHFGVSLLAMDAEKRRGAQIEVMQHCARNNSSALAPYMHTVAKGFSDNDAELNYITATLAGMALELISQWSTSIVASLEQSGTAADMESLLVQGRQPLSLLPDSERTTTEQRIATSIADKERATQKVAQRNQSSSEPSASSSDNNRTVTELDAETLKQCPLCGLPGAKFLDAIYQGDYQRQSYAARSALMSFARNNEDVGFYQIMQGLSGSKELTLLEEVIGYYMLDYSREQDKCFSAGAFEQVFKTDFDGYRIINGYGVEEVRVDPSSVKDVYRLNAPFREACNSLCNQQGPLFLATQLEKRASSREVRDIFSGLGMISEKYACDTPVRKQFEANLLKMWNEERSHSGTKNTLKAAYEQVQRFR